jgi:hypothetical protein
MLTGPVGHVRKWEWGGARTERASCANFSRGNLRTIHRMTAHNTTSGSLGQIAAPQSAHSATARLLRRRTYVAVTADVLNLAI